MKKFVIFDFDGTLVDTLEIVANLFRKIIKKYGYDNVTNEEIESLRNMNPIEIIRNFKFPIWKIPKLVKNVRGELARNVEKIKPYEGISDMLYELKSKGFNLAIITSNSEHTVKKICDKHNINFFDQVIGSDGIFNKSQYLINFIKKHKLQNQDVIYVGDEVRDIEAAQDAYVEIVSVTWGFNKREVLLKNNPNYLVDKPSQILKLLDKSS